MFCMNCVLCINISCPEAKTYEYITYWLISSRIANCFKLTATLTYFKLWDFPHFSKICFLIFGRFVDFLFFSSSIFRRIFLLGRLSIVGLSGEDISYSFCHNIFPCIKDNIFEMTANISNELHNRWLCNLSNECKVVKKKGNISPCKQVHVFFCIIKLNTINTSENTKHIFRTTPLKQY